MIFLQVTFQFSGDKETRLKKSNISYNLYLIGIHGYSTYIEGKVPKLT